MAKIKNLIFDLDNTLYDFSNIWKKSNRLVHYTHRLLIQKLHP